MIHINPWPLLRAGEVEQEQGLRLVQQAYVEQPYASEAMTLGVALMWLGRYSEAWEHFHSFIETAPRVGDNSYGMAGVAKWCLGRPDEAVHEWRTGLRAEYARASGFGIIMPLLLFFAAVLQPDAPDRTSVEQLIRKKILDIRICNWPGPIAKLMIGEISYSDFDNLCSVRSQQETSDRIWLGEFYKSLIQYEQSNHAVLVASMRKLTDTSQSEWQDDNVFLSRIWHEEFFLARHEAL